MNDSNDFRNISCEHATLLQLNYVSRLARAFVIISFRKFETCRMHCKATAWIKSHENCCFADSGHHVCMVVSLWCCYLCWMCTFVVCSVQLSLFGWCTLLLRTRAMLLSQSCFNRNLCVCVCLLTVFVEWVVRWVVLLRT